MNTQPILSFRRVALISIAVVLLSGTGALAANSLNHKLREQQCRAALEGEMTWAGAERYESLVESDLERKEAAIQACATLGSHVAVYWLSFEEIY
jgi:hypothetical protein